MKKLLATIAMALSFVATAKETVTIYYAFSPADSIANYGRTLVQEANRIQDRYTFLFDTKPGAGNAIAANFVKANPNTILFTSSAFWIRPQFYPNESYSVDEFREFMPFCTSPVAISSVKYKSWDEIPKNQPLNLGVSGLGVTTHLISLQIVDKFPNAQPVPFKSTTEAFLGLVSGNIDVSLGFLTDHHAWATDPAAKVKTHVLGITGAKPMLGYKPVADLGFNQITKSLNIPHHMVVPTTTPDAKFREWREIMTRAVKHQSVLDSYKADMCEPLVLKDTELDSWYNEQHQKWKRLTTGIKLN
jgi:tripartite-type tricarboxylate transporter receptor subunit TctC